MSRQKELSKILEKVDLYLKAYKHKDAHDLLKTAIKEHPDAAPLHLKKGLIYHGQSDFPSAVREFAKAIEKKPDFLEALLNLCITLCDLGQYDEAQDVYNKISKLTDTRQKVSNTVKGKIASTHVNSGKTYQEAGLFMEAISEYKKALSLYDAMPDVKIELARIYMETGELTKAERLLESLVEKDPDNHEALTLLGIITFKAGQKDLSRDYLKKARKLDPDGKIPKAFLRVCQTQDI